MCSVPALYSENLVPSPAKRGVTKGGGGSEAQNNGIGIRIREVRL